MASSIFEIASGLWFPSFLQFLSLANASGEERTSEIESQQIGHFSVPDSKKMD
jgi:hypothetical protein